MNADTVDRALRRGCRTVSLTGHHHFVVRKSSRGHGAGLPLVAPCCSSRTVVLTGYALIQWCQWHKRGNIVGYLPRLDRKKWRRKLRRAYRKRTYENDREALKELHGELHQVNRSAARSLEEGLEQTLTLHRLGVVEEVGRSLKPTNAIENLNSLVEEYIGNVKRWHHSEQRAR